MIHHIGGSLFCLQIWFIFFLLIYYYCDSRP
nr:MAG TPA: hypothetical protein [Caudoviricetes sp.]